MVDVKSRVGVLHRGAVLAMALALGSCLAASRGLAAAPSSPTVSEPPENAGESAAPPTANITTRPQLFIVGSSSMTPYIELAIKALLKDYVLPQPKLELKGSKKGIREFCAGVGPEYPDIVAASRGMHKEEFDSCVENGVRDIIEIKIGATALYVVAKKGDPVFDVTPRMVYYALAAEIPEKEDFGPNPNKTWKDVNKNAPAIPIHVIIPEKGSGTRGNINGLFLEGGCRHVKEIDLIYAASERVPKCVTLRTDGAVTEIQEPYGDRMVETLLKSPPGTLAIMAGEVYTKYKDKLETMSVAGVQPTMRAIENYDYELSTNLYFYFKRQHMRNNKGVGVVRGVREFMREITREEQMSRAGTFAQMGLVPLSPSDMQAQRRRVQTLRRFQR